MIMKIKVWDRQNDMVGYTGKQDHNPRDNLKLKCKIDINKIKMGIYSRPLEKTTHFKKEKEIKRKT